MNEMCLIMVITISYNIYNIIITEHIILRTVYLNIIRVLFSDRKAKKLNAHDNTAFSVFPST